MARYRSLAMTAVTRVKVLLRTLIALARTWTVLYVWLPIVSNTTLAAALLTDPPLKATLDVGGVKWLFAFAVFAGAASTITAFVHRDVGPKRTLVATMLHGILTVSVFAGLYRSLGLKENNPPLDIDVAIYFSIVTFTTLGYGDFAPNSADRLLAAMEAILGYVYLGLIVGISANLISRSRRG